MRLVKRFYALIVILLLFVITYLLIISERDSTELFTSNYTLKSIVPIDRFISKLYPSNSVKDLRISTFSANFINKDLKSVIEIDEANIHEVSLIYSENGKFKALNWFKCKPNSEVFLCTNPFFIVNQEILKQNITIVYNGSSLGEVPIKLYGYKDFFGRKTNQEIAKTIILLILFLILVLSLFVYFYLSDFYSIAFSVYMMLTIFSNLIYNGFANNFWPFNIFYVADHSLGFMLSLHVTLMSYFLVYIIGKSKNKFKYHYISHLPLVAAISFLMLSTIFNSYDLLKYLFLFATILGLFFTGYYPKVFNKFRHKDAYWINYLGIIFYTIMLALSTSKYFNLLENNIGIDIINKLLFLGHVFSVFLAFILISKNKVLNKIKNTPTLTFTENIRKLELNQDEKCLSEIFSTLSEREYLVLELISIGLKDQEIADKLCVSITTIKTQKQRVYKKLNINNRSQATQIFLKFISKTINFINN